MAPQFAATVVSQSPAKFGETEAYELTLDVARAQPSANGSSPAKQRVKVVLTRAPQSYVLRDGYRDRVKTRYPAVVIAGYANAPQDFMSNLEEFDELLQRVRLGEQQGYSAGKSVVAPATTKAKATPDAAAEETAVEPPAAKESETPTDGEAPAAAEEEEEEEE